MATAEAFAQLSPDERRAVARAVAHDLGPTFEATDDLVGAQEHATFRHVETNIEFVLLPGGTFEMGFTEADQAELQRHFDLLGDPQWMAWLERWAPLARPTRMVTVTPFALSREVIGKAEIAQLVPGTENNSQLEAEDAVRFAAAAGFRLPSEAEWEYVAREGTSAAFLLEATEYLEFGCHRMETLGGLLHTGRGEVMADRWHPIYDGAPTTSEAWTTGDEARVFRGFTSGMVGYDEEVASAICALRVSTDIRTDPHFFLRLALSPDATGRWRFPLSST